ncbi:hypothetical protein ABWL39_03555 [Chitinivorax sp. PXF-14]|uniref:hypothetical protein n=1 Tax=Chitinivorax sp. PXF-14 TaxID=3230488 RepID=UPI003467142B
MKRSLFSGCCLLMVIQMQPLQAAPAGGQEAVTVACGDCQPGSRQTGTPASGLRFSCPAGEVVKFGQAVDAYLLSNGISMRHIAKTIDTEHGTLSYVMRTDRQTHDTLALARHPALRVKDERLLLPGAHGTMRPIHTVSKQEILLALMQTGRLTAFDAPACSLDTLKDHVAIRQNIVAWAENLNWVWPNGGQARWNTRYWRRGTPRHDVPLHVAVNDAFINQRLYSIGCYTGAKLVMIQGVLDYYQRIKRDPEQVKRIEARLWSNQDPLTDIEPGRMWDFEADFDNKEQNRPGKLLTIQYGVPARHFVPGDWAYFLNTDAKSYQKTGYEGSNAIYLGRNRFDDFYNDHNHAYTYHEKLDEVYQWRHGVFSRSRDAAKIKPLSRQAMARLEQPPKQGGLVNDFRVYPYFFGAPLPELPRQK